MARPLVAVALELDDPARRLSRYAGVIARATSALASAAAKLGVPVVNVWRNSPAAAKLAGVFPDEKSIGSAAADTLLMRGFSSFACGYFSDDASAAESAASFCHTIETTRPGLTVAHLPVNTSMMVKHIAREVGMTKPLQIHQLIKHKTGMGPVEYRRMMQSPGHHAVAEAGKRTEEPS